jgi:hypothetical protein
MTINFQSHTSLAPMTLRCTKRDCAIFDTVGLTEIYYIDRNQYQAKLVKRGRTQTENSLFHINLSTVQKCLQIKNSSIN